MKDNLKKYIEREWPYWALLVIMVVVTINHFANIDSGFCTAWDESYFLLKLQEAYDATCITGKSQWNLIAIHWFPFLNLTNPIHSRIAIFLCETLCAVMTTIMLVCTFDRHRVIKYFSVSYLFFFLIPTTYAGNSLNYVPMQAVLLTGAIDCYILCYTTARHHFWIELMMGIFIGLSMFVIMPSGVLIFFCIVGVFILNGRIKSITHIILGMSMAAIWVHWIVCPLDEILDAMRFTATYIAKSGYGYTPTQFIIQILMFLKDWGIVVIYAIGSYTVCYRLIGGG